MLQVDALAGDETPDLATTKPDKSAHGFGIAGMREIAERYGGSLDAQAGSGRFELLVCLPLPKTPERKFRAFLRGSSRRTGKVCSHSSRCRKSGQKVAGLPDRFSL